MNAERIKAGVWNVLNDLIADHPMWISDDGEPLDYRSEREGRIAQFIQQATEAVAEVIAREAGEREAALRALADKWRWYHNACITGQANSRGEPEDAPRMLWIAAAEALERALDGHSELTDEELFERIQRAVDNMYDRGEGDM